jgi:hypothetical protein
MEVRVKDAGKSECRFVMKRIGVEIFFGVRQIKSTSLPAKAVQTSYAGALLRETMKKVYNSKSTKR